MAAHKVLLFYKFTPITDPEAIRVWQRDLCELLGLGGRILISPHGINATVGGELQAVKTYWRKTRAYPAFREIDFKWSAGDGTEFPRLSVKVRDELVGFGAADEVQVDSTGVVGGGTHLTPQQLHDLVAEKDVTFFDGRNKWEASIGRFTGAVVPDIETSHDFIRELESGKYDHLKSEPVVTYCTGGIRCEVLSALMINRGFEEVYQLDGGIVRYGEAFGDTGLWEGSLAVFDNRKTVNFSATPAVLGSCAECEAPTSRMEYCADPSCRVRLVLCDTCAATHPHCAEHQSVSA